MPKLAIEELLESIRQLVPDADETEMVSAAALQMANDAAKHGLMAAHGAQLARIIVWLRHNAPRDET